MMRYIQKDFTKKQRIFEDEVKGRVKKIFLKQKGFQNKTEEMIFEMKEDYGKK